MRLVTWNAGRGRFEKKVPLLDRLQADIAVIPEIAPPAVASRHVLWLGEKNQGLAVVSRDPYRVSPLPRLEGVPKYIFPVAVDGPSSFVLFAVWTLGKQPQRYVRAASTAIDMYEHLFSSHPTVLMGDFNSNAIWDTHHPAGMNHSAMVNRLESLGLVSAYHHFRGEEHGEETQPTFYLHWDETKPYHIDYCFLPTKWAPRIALAEVGSFEGWRECSDHRPLLVEVKPAA